ncbi:MAG: chromosome segregation protein SMC [Phycisphaerae bacterium]|nr:chromosome segregation protein SMC [Phycisphaerae bacterium]
MRLEKIILNGFKSFADKTEFTFDHSVTAIVGPNGCGKSNVVDAVKWVLGEQRVKSLRSDQMTDVIFGGSGARKPLGAAEVTLVLSNPEVGGARRLPLDTESVQITRKVLRSGEGEYRINNRVCRLKDLRELFMDTGVATRAYSIIEQGQVEQVVAASAVDRRIVFEEAAGISKYKAHKREALRRLEHAEQNLLRLADILGEVTRRLRSVKVQAGKARSFLEATQRLKELQVNYSLVEYAKNDDLLRQRRQVLEGTSQAYAQLAADLSRSDVQVSELGTAVLEKEHALTEVGNRLVSAQSRIDQLLQRMEFLRSRIGELTDRSRLRLQQMESLRRQAGALQADLAQVEGHLAAAEKDSLDKRQAADVLEEEIRQTEAELAQVEAELRDEKTGIIDIVRRTAQLHNEIQSLSDFRTNLSQQKDRLSTRAQTATAELEKVLADKAQYKARLDDIEKVLQDLQGHLEAKRGEAESVEASLTEGAKVLASHKERRSALHGELAVLKDMEDRYEGLTKTVKGILQGKATGDQGLSYVEGILAQTIETDVEYAGAVEAALEGMTDAVVVTSRQALLADRGRVESWEGRVHVVFSEEAAPFVDQADLSEFDGVAGRLVEFVRYAPCHARLAWRLLGRTIVVDSLDRAVDLSGRMGGGYRWVTPKGETLHEDGSLSVGPLGRATGLISRKSRMRQLEQAVAETTAQIDELQTRITKDTQTHSHLGKLCKDLRTAVYEASTEKMQVGSKVGALEQTVQRLQQEQPLIAGEIGQLERQIAQSVQREYDSKQKLSELEAVNTERTARIAELESQLTALKERRQMRVAELTEVKVQIGQMTEQARSARQRIAGIRDQTQASLQAIQSAQQEAADAARQIDQAGRDILAAESAVSDLYVEKERAQEENRLLQEQIESLVQRQRQTEQSSREQRQQKGLVEQQINDLRVELAQIEVRQQDLVARVKDDLQIDLVEAYQTYTQQPCDWEAVRAEITELRAKIERLGNVNVEAIDEQKVLEERNDFLSKQVEDLNQSKAQLEQLIARLNKDSRERFVKTFEQIRENFQGLFRKLFGGGRADIILEEAADVLDAGIEVIAKPPGKETRSISLLSGGEKSMTALALLFAVFRTKPSPFCFLDEVDAALDEANNERFNLIIREFQADTQFVVITHSKRTMSVAEVLFGVTMQTQGVSKKISVRFDEYEPQQAVA